MATVQADGTKLEYVETGAGEPVVFVHGSISDHRTWQFQLEEFGKRFHVVAYSRRFHWPNEPIPEGADPSTPLRRQPRYTASCAASSSTRSRCM